MPRELIKHEEDDRAFAPSTSVEVLKQRHEFLKGVREFLDQRGYVEVDTPLLSGAATGHHDLSLFKTEYVTDSGRQTLFLQPSPESAMKRLLAAGSGPIYQICKAFRNGDEGDLHNPEFSILEWYRPGFDHFDLMSEFSTFLEEVLGYRGTERITYQNLFQDKVGIDPHTSETSLLREAAIEAGLRVDKVQSYSRDRLLRVIMDGYIEPTLGEDGPVFIYHYPASQACFAKMRGEAEPVAERFEVYIKGIEIANGYHEATDPEEQRRRIEVENERRRPLGLPPIPVDERLISALESGLPDCSGVAVGIDRLVMIGLNLSTIDDVVAFPIDKA